MTDERRPANPARRTSGSDASGIFEGDDDLVPMAHGLDRLLRHLGGPEASTLASLTDRWGEVVGPLLAAHSRPGDLVDGVLAVTCDDGAWASQIRWQEEMIRTRFSEVFAGTIVKRLKVRVRPDS